MIGRRLVQGFGIPDTVQIDMTPEEAAGLRRFISAGTFPGMETELVRVLSAIPGIGEPPAAAVVVERVK